MEAFQAIFVGCGAGFFAPCLATAVIVGVTGIATVIVVFLLVWLFS